MKIESNKIINILIPDGETLLTMSVIRCFSTLDFVNLHIVSSKKWIDVRFSKEIKSFSHYNFGEKDKQFITFLKNQIKKYDIDVLMPILFPTIKLLSLYKSEFEQVGLKLCVASVANLDTANNKGLLARFALTHNLPHPKTVDLLLINNDKKLEYPFLLKPICGWNGNKIHMIRNQVEFKKMTSGIECKKDYLVQQYIEGYDIDMSVMCSSGEILAHTIQKAYVPDDSPLKPPKGIEFLDNTQIFLIVQRLMRALCWSGVAHIDLRYDKKKDEYVIIEINPRFWGSVNASEKAGVNFPYLYCLSSLKKEYSKPLYRYIKFVNNRGYFKVLFSKLKKSKSYQFPDFCSIFDDIKDPLPKLFKYLNKVYIKLYGKRIATS